MGDLHQVRFTLSIPAHTFEAYYAGAARQVQVTAADGRRVRFPAGVLRPYLSHQGIHGEFVIDYDQAGRFKGIRRLGG